MPIEKLEDNKWYRTQKGFFHICCDCCLTHFLKLKIKDGKIYFKWVRDNKRTYAYRRSENNKKELKSICKKL